MSESLLQRLMADPVTHSRVIDALALIVTDEVRSSRGVSGVALRSACRTLERVKPNFIRRAVTQLLPEWLQVLQRHYDGYNLSGGGTDFEHYLVAHRDVVAQELLDATHRRASRSGNRMARTLFRRVKGNAHSNLRHAVPRLARVFGGVIEGI